jgi:hypothetical protein
MNKHDELIEHLRGLREIVINECHGGFGLSHTAVLRYHELNGDKIYWRAIDRASSWSPVIYFFDRDDEKNSSWDDSDIDRDDPILVRVVKELGGEAAGGPHAVLKVVQIPANVDWIIQEYDGQEWIAERHRTWS